MKEKIKGELNRAYEASKSHTFTLEEWKNEEWEGIKETDAHGKMKDTGISVDLVRDIGVKISTLPADWDFHP